MAGSKRKSKRNLKTKNSGVDKVKAKNKSNKKITHQLLFCGPSKKKQKFNNNNKQKNVSVENPNIKPTIYKGLSRKEKSNLPLHERVLEKLRSARFRYLNEQMYTNTGSEAKTYFETDPEAFNAYHEGYKQQVTRWPVNPVDIIIKKIKKLPSTFIIADFGCGEAKLAQSVSQTVHSFDLVAANESVTACDMSRVPLESKSVDVVVFCLSLMGTNLKDYFIEANRVLKIGGLLKIAEVESRFDDVNYFCQCLQSFGFTEVKVDTSMDLFYLLDTTKSQNVFSKKSFPAISLQPCLYKKR